VKWETAKTKVRKGGTFRGHCGRRRIHVLREKMGGGKENIGGTFVEVPVPSCKNIGVTKPSAVIYPHDAQSRR